MSKSKLFSWKSQLLSSQNFTRCWILNKRSPWGFSPTILRIWSHSRPLNRCWKFSSRCWSSRVNLGLTRFSKRTIGKSFLRSCYSWCEIQKSSCKILRRNIRNSLSKIRTRFLLKRLRLWSRKRRNSCIKCANQLTDAWRGHSRSFASSSSSGAASPSVSKLRSRVHSRIWRNLDQKRS